MGKSTLDMVGKLLAADKATAKKQQEMADKGKGYIGSMEREVGENISFRKADAGGMIACWYGPNGSRDIIVKDAKEGAAVLQKFFAGSDDSEA